MNREHDHSPGGDGGGGEPDGRLSPAGDARRRAILGHALRAADRRRHRRVAVRAAGAGACAAAAVLFAIALSARHGTPDPSPERMAVQNPQPPATGPAPDTATMPDAGFIVRDGVRHRRLASIVHVGGAPSRPPGAAAAGRRPGDPRRAGRTAVDDDRRRPTPRRPRPGRPTLGHDPAQRQGGDLPVPTATPRAHTRRRLTPPMVPALHEPPRLNTGRIDDGQDATGAHAGGTEQATGEPLLEGVRTHPREEAGHEGELQAQGESRARRRTARDRLRFRD
jgi:hypothetical protein